MKKRKILVTGGAGYIGSHMIRLLSLAGYRVIVLDNFVTGHQEAIEEFDFVTIDLLDPSSLNKFFAKEEIAAVMHFSALIEVGASVKNPEYYYFNNVVGTMNLLKTMLMHQVKYFIFSSTAAVYGEPRYVPLDEQHIIAPINPYGKSKAMVEQLLEDYAKAYGLNYTTLRYFNAAGAHPSGEIGENHEPETHLIPNILMSVINESSLLQIYGDDFDTPDGTCIRDYIHVMDLCDAHLLALEALLNSGGSHCYNLGNGEGYSVKTVVKSVEKVINQAVPYQIQPKRSGDPAVLVADSSRIRVELGWKPRYSLEEMIADTWRFLVRKKKKISIMGKRNIKEE